MGTLRPSNREESCLVELTEWQQVGPTTDYRLRGRVLDGKSRNLAAALRGRVDIRELHDGLEITSTSFVGRFDLGPLRISIAPKLPALPLTRLLRYAYGLRDLTALEETLSPTARHGLHDLLIALLAGEVEELLHRGLVRRYVAQSEKLESPRGRILVERVIREGGLREARLPCRFFERRTDWHLNQVLRSGLDFSALLTQDRDLRRRLHLLADMFGDVEPLHRLGRHDVDRAERELTRMSDASRPALTIIRLLIDTLGLAFESQQRMSGTLGFLFDMNKLFQRLLSRFLREHLTISQIADEKAIRNLFVYAPEANPRKRNAPTPKPDYALSSDNRLIGFLDAKYRDVWDRGLPVDWLYQLSLYALASPSRNSVLLYASMERDASDEEVMIRQPLAGSAASLGSVIVRPVALPYLADLLAPDLRSSFATERRRFADELVALHPLSGRRVRRTNEVPSCSTPLGNLKLAHNVTTY